MHLQHVRSLAVFVMVVAFAFSGCPCCPVPSPKIRLVLDDPGCRLALVAAERAHVAGRAFALLGAAPQDGARFEEHYRAWVLTRCTGDAIEEKRLRGAMASKIGGMLARPAHEGDLSPVIDMIRIIDQFGSLYREQCAPTMPQDFLSLPLSDFRQKLSDGSLAGCRPAGGAPAPSGSPLPDGTQVGMPFGPNFQATAATCIREAQQKLRYLDASECSGLFSDKEGTSTTPSTLPKPPPTTTDTMDDGTKITQTTTKNPDGSVKIDVTVMTPDGRSSTATIVIDPGNKSITLSDPRSSVTIRSDTITGTIGGETIKMSTKDLVLDAVQDAMTRPGVSGWLASHAVGGADKIINDALPALKSKAFFSAMVDVVVRQGLPHHWTDSKRCIAPYVDRQGGAFLYVRPATRSAGTPSLPLAFEDFVASCMCKALGTSGGMGSCQTQTEQHQRAQCALFPYGPDDRPLKECSQYLQADTSEAVERMCARMPVRCKEGTTPALQQSIGPDGHRHLACTCRDGNALNTAVREAFEYKRDVDRCSVITCAEGICACSGGRCGCRPIGPWPDPKHQLPPGCPPRCPPGCPPKCAPTGRP